MSNDANTPPTTTEAREEQDEDKVRKRTKNKVEEGKTPVQGNRGTEEPNQQCKETNGRSQGDLDFVTMETTARGGIADSNTLTVEVPKTTQGKTTGKTIGKTIGTIKNIMRTMDLLCLE